MEDASHLNAVHGFKVKGQQTQYGFCKGSACRLRVVAVHQRSSFTLAGVKISDAYNAVLEYVKKEKADLVSKLTKNLG